MLIILGSRLGLFLFAAAGLYFKPLQAAPNQWRGFPHNLFLDGWARWDSGWYAQIARSGYIAPHLLNLHQARNTAFFPLYPLSMRLVATVTHNVYGAGFLVANLCFIAAIGALFRLIELKLDRDTAFRATLLLALWPWSFFFNAAYSESMFLMFVAMAFLAAERRHWLLAGILAAGVTATRPMGVLILPALALIYLQQIDFKLRRIRWNITWIGLGVLGIGGYMAFLWQRYDDPLEFVRVQSVSAWSQSHRLWPLLVAPHAAFILAVAGAAGLLFVRRGRLWIYALWALAMCAISFWKLGSFGRLAIVIFPCFIAAGTLLVRRSLLWLVLAGSSAYMLVNLFRFSHWISVG